MPHRRFHLLVFFLLYSVIMSAQKKALLLPVQVNGLWGFIDTSGVMKIEPQFDWAGFFSEGLAPVMQHGKVHLVEKTGNLIPGPGFDLIELVGDSLMLVKSGDKWGAHVVTGKEVVPCAYDEVFLSPEKTFFAFRKDSLWGFAGPRGKMILPASCDTGYIFRGNYIRYEKDGKYGLVSLKGRMLLEPVASEISMTDTLIFYMQDSRWGCITVTGRKIFDPVWMSYSVLSRNFITLRCDSGMVLASASGGRIVTDCGEYDDFIRVLPFTTLLSTLKNGLYGLIDTSGREIFTPQFEDLAPLDGDYWLYQRSGKYGICTIDGRILTDPRYDRVGNFYRHIGKAYTGDKCGVINNRGVEIIAPCTDNLQINRQVIKVKKSDGSVSIAEVDENGNLIERNNYVQIKTIKIGGGAAPDNANPSTTLINGVSANSAPDLDTMQWYFVPKIQRWGLKNNITGDTIFKPAFTDVTEYPQLDLTRVELLSFSTGISAGKKNVTLPHKYGLVRTRAGKYLVGPQYSSIRMSDFSDKVFTDFLRCTKMNGETGLLWPEKPNSFYPMTYVETPVNGISRVCIGGTWRQVSTKDSATCSFEKLAAMFGADYSGVLLGFNPERRWLRLEHGQWGFMDRTGNFLTPVIYEDVKEMKNKHAIVKSGGHWGVLTNGIKNEGYVFTLSPIYDKIEYVEASNQKLYVVQQYRSLFGFINRAGLVSVSAGFEQCKSFSEGRVAVRRDNKWGFADSMGTVVVPIEYTDVHPYKEGLARAKKKGKWGYIDPDGNVLTDFIYESATDFEDGCAYIRHKGKSMILDRSGNPVLLEKNFQVTGFIGEYRVAKGKKGVGLLDAANNWILKPQYTSITKYSCDTLFVVRKKQFSGIANRAGKWIQKPQLTRIGKPGENLFPAAKESKWGFLDAEGRWAVEPQFARVDGFSEGRAAVKLNGKWGYITSNGTFAIEPQFFSAGPFSEGRAFVTGKKGGMYIDERGSILFELPDRAVGQAFHNGIALVRLISGDCHFIDMNGRKLFGRTFIDASDFSNDLARFKTPDGWGMISKSGMVLIEPHFERINDFDGPLASFQQTKFYGVVNMQGHQVVAPVADRIVMMNSNLFYVQSGRSIGYLRPDGSWLWEGRR
ncbi:MAG: KWG repeat-containing protein [Bacteroidetes bacterium]|nr:MAG: KWG repeat-containing protein [Bacteroidota bacterium]